MGMRLIAFEREILVTECEQISDRRVKPHYGQWAQRARELQLGLLQVVEVKVRVAECVHELAYLQPRYLRHQQGEQGIGRDIEWYAKEHVGRTLIELTRKPAIRHIELEKAGTW